jgi:hypothetical protein
VLDEELRKQREEMQKEMDLKKTIAAPEKKEGGFNEAI